MIHLLLGFLCVFLLTKLIQRMLLNRRLPPGPWGLPFIGILPWIHPVTAHLTFTEWSERYGGLMSFWCGPKLVLVLTDLKVMKEALLKQADVFSGRPRSPIAELTHKNHG